MKRVTVDHPPVAQREHLHRGALGRDGHADHVDRADRAPLDGLALGEPLDRAQPISVARRVLEPLVGRRLVHLLLEPAPDRPVVAREKLDHLVDHVAVVLLRDVADARRVAALDVVVETRDAAAPPGLRPLARPVAKDAVQDVERLAHLLRVRVRPEVHDATPVSLTGEHDPRIVVLDRDRDVGERLVVAQPDVERRTMALDEVLLEVERLDLGLRDDGLDRLDPVGHLADPLPCVARPFLEIGTNTWSQRLRLPDVQDCPSGVPKQVDARLLRDPFELILDAFDRHEVSVIGRPGHDTRMRSRLLATSVALLLVAVGAGCGAKHKLVVGAVEDSAKWAPDPARTMAETRDSGFRAIVVSAVWRRGATVETDLPPLRRAVRAAVAANLRPLLAVYQTSGDTPAGPSDRAAFASYAAGLARALPSVRDVLVGNEPNLNLFWQPQFGAAGAMLAAVQYEALLASTYDALKSVDPDLTVIGGNLAPRGGDDPRSSRPTHSPTAFIRDLGAALPGQWSRPAVDGRLLDSRVRRELAHSAVVRPPEHDVDRDRRLREAGRRCSEQPSTGRRSRDRASRSSTASTASRPPSHRRSARSIPAGRSFPRSTRRPRRPTTARRSSWPSVSRT